MSKENTERYSVTMPKKLHDEMVKTAEEQGLNFSSLYRVLYLKMQAEDKVLQKHG